MAQRRDAIDVLYLLPYSARLHPNELWIADLKDAIMKPALPRHKGELKQAVIALS